VAVSAPSHADFRAGRGLKVFELNGLTSESMHIYDEGIALVEGWRTSSIRPSMARGPASESATEHQEGEVLGRVSA
jgi:hypothetical protein